MGQNYILSLFLRRLHGVPVCWSVGAPREGERGGVVEHGQGGRLRRPPQARRLPSHHRLQVDHQQVGQGACADVSPALPQV
jgi:hypothetical protein